ncbi:Hermansky-Pudlak syndrome 4 protein [Oryzias latipes]|uniref:HPS4 biogenesis of lysosomal organelles complex 3 subunit 2 n=1 Tax=Oryzias latipes TaxID=8090 RepID=H2MIA2_ORYLA|nr:Hermansky-Pudlak syndrome 4 protein [Oryzias latipes]
MAELILPDSRRCHYFFLYDGSKVRGEDDPTRKGICYFYPEETPLDKQDLLCSQLAGVGRCVSELSSSQVSTLRLRRCKFAIRMKDDFFWALGCSVDTPTVSVCELLHQLINLFCFYNGPVRMSYELNSRETLAARWTCFLSHLLSAQSPLHYIFSCLRTMDLTNVDPLLLLKAALILQACQRCPLVLAGCIIFKGRVVSTQLSPELTMKVMVHEREMYNKAQRTNGTSAPGSFGCAVSSTGVFLTPPELQHLRSPPVNKDSSSHSSSQKDALPRRSRLSRTLSDTPSSEPEPSDPTSPHSSQKLSVHPHWSELDNSVFSPTPTQSAAGSTTCSPRAQRPSSSQRRNSHKAEEETLHKFYYQSFHDSTRGVSQIEGEESSTCEGNLHLNGGDGACETEFDFSGPSANVKTVSGDNEACCRSTKDHMTEVKHLTLPHPHTLESNEQSSLIAMTLYVHRVNSLVLALLVEPHFLNDTASIEEVYHSSLASLNGLEAHLHTISPAAPEPAGQYLFAHYDCIQNTLTTNVSGRAVGALEHPFVRATSLLHSHFCSTETLQEAIIRSAGTAVYGTRNVAQETFFQQLGGPPRNSGIPNHQDSAFSLPSKARHRLLKHGVNLL